MEEKVDAIQERMCESVQKNVEDRSQDDLQKEKIDPKVNIELVIDSIIECFKKKIATLVLGKAGTGKTNLIRKLVEKLVKNHKYNFDEIGVCGTTGLASSNIASYASTLNALFCIKIANKHEEMIKNSFMAKQKIIKMKVLIIDEISMLGGHFFEEFDLFLKHIRCSTQFFGGISVLFIGDFCQLPPVGKDEIMLFESKKFYENVKNRIVLTHIFRQEEKEFLNLLSETRYGKLSGESIRILESKTWDEDLLKDGDIKPTRLFSKNVDVDQINLIELSKLPGKSKRYSATDTKNERIVIGGLDLFNKNTLVQKVLILKVGAQVIHLKNDKPKKLVNGSRGVVVDFSKEGFPKVKFSDGEIHLILPTSIEILLNKGNSNEIVYKRIQIPLKLGWALTIHKSQGMTLDSAIVSFKDSFAFFQMYVALSRIRTLAGLYVESFDPRLVKADPKVLNYYALFDEQSKRFCRENYITQKVMVTDIKRITSYFGKRSATVMNELSENIDAGCDVECDNECDGEIDEEGVKRRKLI
jgi:ATP-dependent exoDNAse (exonuclease V) alpha subunit